MKKLKLTSYSDPGHGWLKVPRKLLKELGIEEKITSFSYQLGDFVYLEEDCDASAFASAMEEKYKAPFKELVEMKSNYSNKQSKIRSYPRFRPGFVRVSWEHGKRVKLYGKPYTMICNGHQNLLFDGLRSYRISKAQLDEIVLDTEGQSA
jgi:hypothetical protein